MDSQSLFLILIHWIVIYLVDSDLQQLIYWDQDSNGTYKCINEGFSTFFTLI